MCGTFALSTTEDLYITSDMITDLGANVILQLESISGTSSTSGSVIKPDPTNLYYTFVIDMSFSSWTPATSTNKNIIAEFGGNTISSAVYTDSSDDLHVYLKNKDHSSTPLDVNFSDISSYIGRNLIIICYNYVSSNNNIHWSIYINNVLVYSDEITYTSDYSVTGSNDWGLGAVASGTSLSNPVSVSFDNLNFYLINDTYANILALNETYVSQPDTSRSMTLSTIEDVYITPEMIDTIGTDMDFYITNVSGTGTITGDSTYITSGDYTLVLDSSINSWTAPTGSNQNVLFEGGGGSVGSVLFVDTGGLKFKYINTNGSGSTVTFTTTAITVADYETRHLFIVSLEYEEYNSITVNIYIDNVLELSEQQTIAQFDHRIFGTNDIGIGLENGDSPIGNPVSISYDTANFYAMDYCYSDLLTLNSTYIGRSGYNVFQSITFNGSISVGADIFTRALIGGIEMFYTDTLPNNYILCDGSQISTATSEQYRILIEVLQGVTIGSTSGVQTAYLPNFSNRFAMGWSGSFSSYENASTVNETGNNDIDISYFPQHKHNITGNVTYDQNATVVANLINRVMTIDHNKEITSGITDGGGGAGISKLNASNYPNNTNGHGHNTGATNSNRTYNAEATSDFTSNKSNLVSAVTNINSNTIDLTVSSQYLKFGIRYK